jgi:TetR/AcrR family transcriptional repressor of nem operon
LAFKNAYYQHVVRPREFDEATVIQQALGVFWKKGFDGTSVQDLVEATGLQRGSIYGAFGDKRTLFLAALDAYMAAVLKGFDEIARNAEDPVDAIRDQIRHFGERSKGPQGPLGCMVNNTLSELVGQDDTARARIQSFLAEMRGRFASALKAGQEAGTFDSSRDAEALASFLQCTIHGLMLLAKSKPSPQVIDSIVSEFLRALD